MPENDCQVREDGAKVWYRNGVVHREGGPAIERTDGTCEWYAEGVRHRDDGPAIISPDGQCQWFQHGTRLSETEFNEMRRRAIEEIANAFHKGTKRAVTVRRKPLELRRKQ
jgi:hypothetical protein